VDTPIVKTFPLGVVFHILLSPEDLIFQGHLPYLSSGLAFTMRIGPSQIPSDSPLGCLLANLGLLHLCLILSYESSFFSVIRDNASKWPLNGTFNLNILRELYNLCERAGKWKELSYIQSFPYFCIKPSLCTFCSPAQILLACKPVFK
jgi:hypothetical protein